MKMRLLGILILLVGFISQANAQEWTKAAGALNQVSAIDQSTAWGVNQHDQIVRTKDSGKTWQQVPGNLRQVSALSYDSAWGVNGSGQIWRTRDGGKTWDNRPGRLKQVSGVDYETAWGVNEADEIWRTNNGGASWDKRPGLLRQVSALSYESAWGVNAGGEIFRTQNGGANWDRRPGQLKWVSAASYDVAAGVNANDGIYRTRDGGASWQVVAGLLKQISALSYDNAWGVNAGNDIFVRFAADTSAQPAGSSQVVQAEAVIKPICPDGQAAAAGGECVTEVFFHREEGLSLDDARARVAETGNALATAAQVKTAWEKLNFDAYAYGRLADGSFAVPVQGDHFNYKKGVNLGATGGNQGFFFVAGCPAGQKPGRLGRCEAPGVAPALGGISMITLAGADEPRLTQATAKTWNLFRKGSYDVETYYEADRNNASIMLRDLWGQRTIKIDLLNGTATGGGALSLSSKIIAATDPANRENWFVWPGVATASAGVTYIEFGDDTNHGNRVWGALEQVADNKWILKNEAGLFVTELAQTKRDAQTITLQHPNYSVIVVDFKDKLVNVAVQATSADKSLLHSDNTGKARIVRTENKPYPTHWGPGQNQLIAAQESAANTDRALTSPLSENDLNSVMEWIGKQDSASTVPYCYRNTTPREGFEWKGGDPALPNYSGPKARCEAKYGAGKCEQGVGLMYPTCKAGQYGDGPLCWQHCPTTRMVMETGQNTKLSCGIGCAMNNDVCVKQTADMVLAPINAVLSIISLGTSSAATSASNAALGGAADAAAGVTKVALSDPKWVKLLAALDKAEDVFGKITDAKDNIEYIIDNVENLETEIGRWNANYDANFASLTSSRIDYIIDRKFPDPDDASYIKQKYGQYKLTTMLESDQWRIWRSVATFAGFEPTGIVATVDVFAQPMCIHTAEPFPAVRILNRSQRGAPDPLIRAN